MTTPEPLHSTAVSWVARDLRGGDVLWREDAEPTVVFVERGRLQLSLAGTTWRVGAGDVVGMGALHGDHGLGEGAQALEPTRVWVASAAELDAMDLAMFEHAPLLELGRRSAARQLDGLLGRLAQRNPTEALAIGAGLTDVLAERAMDSLEEAARVVALAPGDTVSPPRRHGALVVTAGRLELRRGDEAVGALTAGCTMAPVAHLDPAALTLTATVPTWVVSLDGDALDPLPPRHAAAIASALAALTVSRMGRAARALAGTAGPVGNLEPRDPAFQPRSPLALPLAGPGHQIDASAMPAPARVEAPPHKADLLRAIREGVIGGNEAMRTPFGLRRITYADYTASGRSLQFIEDFLREEVMPLYANTHTEASASGLQTTRFREEARQIIARACHCTDDDAVLFCGSGATGGVNRLVDLLGLRLPADAADAQLVLDAHPVSERPVVLVGPYEHHSNLLPWQHSLAELHIVPQAADGTFDLAALEAMLERFADRRLVIGSFSAASNVTGIATDVDRVAEVLHRHGALSFWDYAAAGPYVAIDMNPSPTAYKDAVFLSPHKFVGGPGTPGLLILKRALARHTVPTQPGGGTVDFVTMSDDDLTPLYSDDLEHREEAGTPAILESIRCGLVFQLKEQVGAETIHHMESAYTRAAVASWEANPAIQLLGNPHAERLSITSFLVRYGEQYVHHNFVIAVLNDLFGIQGRGGCSCAGPYGGMLLGLTQQQGTRFLECVDDGWGSLKPGWARVNFNYFISQREFAYLIDAVHLVALHGWALMPAYDFDPRSGLWTHRDKRPAAPQQLSALRFADGRMRWDSARATLLESSLSRQLDEGRAVLEQARATAPPPLPDPELPAAFEAYRWFPLPHEVASWLRRHHTR